MKKFLFGIILLSLLCPMVFSNGTQENAASGSAEDVVIGFSFPTLREERWAIEKEIAIDYADQLGIKLIVQDANCDTDVQNQQVDNLITQGVDCLIIGPNDVNACSAAVKSAQEAGIPVISYLRLIDSPGLSLFVGYDFTMIGKDMAESALGQAPKGNYVIIAGDQGDNVSYLLKEGFYSVLKEQIDQKEIDIVFEQHISGWSAEGAMSNMENALTNENNNVKAVLAENDTLAGACIQALKSQGLDGKVFVSGMDGDLAALQRIAEGTQSMTMFFEHDVIARAVIDAAVEIATKSDSRIVNGTVIAGGEDVPAVLLSASKITSKTIDEIILGKNLYTVDQVYKNVPKESWPE